jgi:hypothetical protein
MSQLSANPIEFIQRTQEYINENPELFEEFMAELEEQSQEPVGYEEDGRYVPREEFESMRQQLESFQEDQETQEQLRILDNVMDQLHNDHGSFNDDYVLLRISQGMSPEEAVQSWEQEATQFIDSRKSPTAPRLLSGQGGTPLDQVDKSKLKDPAFRKEYGAELLKAQFGR